jgi:molecular chaperone DnaK
MKLGEAMYKAQQAEGETAAAGGETGTSEEKPAEEDVVDAEFSEVDDENKS